MSWPRFSSLTSANGRATTMISKFGATHSQWIESNFTTKSGSWVILHTGVRHTASPNFRWKKCAHCFTSLCPTRWHVTVQRVDSPLKKHSTLCLMVTEVAWKKSFRSCSTIGSSKVRRRSHLFSHSRCFLHRRQMWMVLRTHSPGYAHYPAHHRPMDQKQPAVCWIWQSLSFLIYTIITINKTRITIFFYGGILFWMLFYICFSIRFFLLCVICIVANIVHYEHAGTTWTTLDMRTT